MNDAKRPALAIALGTVSALACPGAAAQTCTSPTHVFVQSTVTGSTCGSNKFPELNHGTIRTPGDDLVFKVYGGEYGVTSVTLTGDPGMYVFVCSGCGINAECVASGEVDASGTASIEYPQDDRDYYVIVDSDWSCGDYWLSANGPLSAEP